MSGLAFYVSGVVGLHQIKEMLIIIPFFYSLNVLEHIERKQAMEKEELYARAADAERDIAREIEGICHFLYMHPELGGKEFGSTKYLAELMAANGFRVQCPLGSQATAFRADYGEGKGPLVAFLAEYDALPGYGPEKKPGHACGHNWIAAQCCGTALALRETVDMLGGRVCVVGAPAEETYGGKVIAAREGFYDDVDAAIQFHPCAATVFMGEMLAISSYKFTFLGKAAHASASPWDGVNALDAVIETFAGINALRQQLKPDVRIHGIITEGGQAPNIIPDRASCYFFVRAARRGYLDTVCERVIGIAEGAAKMTGAILETTSPDLPFDNYLLNSTLTKLARKQIEMEKIPISELDFSAGSSDVGNVSYICPTVLIGAEISEGNNRFAAHEESTLSLVDSQAAYDALHKFNRVAARMAIDIWTEPEWIRKAKTEVEAGKDCK